MAFISNSITASLRGNSVGTSSFSTSASYASSSLSSSYAGTASFALSLVNPPVAGAILSASSPGTQPSGTLWWNTDDGNLYLQVSASSGSVYVPAMNTVAGSTFGATFRGSYSGTTWTVNHNLGTTSPLIQVYSGSAVMIPASIVSTDANTSTVTFASGFSGSVVASTGVGGTTTASLALNATNAVTASYLSTPTICLQGDFNQPNTGNTNIVYASAPRLNPTSGSNQLTIGNFTVSNTGITPNESGIYEISFIGYIQDAGANSTVGYLFIGVNGTEVYTSQVSMTAGFRASFALVSVSPVTAGQLVDFKFGANESVSIRNSTLIIRRLA